MGLLDGVGSIISDTVLQHLTPDMVDALSNALAHPADASGAPANAMSDALSHLASDLQVNLDPNAAVERAVDATAEAASVVLPANVDPVEFADRLGDLHGALQGVATDAAGRLSSPDPEVRASAQAELDHTQQLMDLLQSTMTQLHDDNVHVIDNLHANADGWHDGDATVVAVADSADGHASAHADQDSSTGHAADHVDAAPPHEDVAASDPSTTSA